MRKYSLKMKYFNPHGLLLQALITRGRGQLFQETRGELGQLNSKLAWSFFGYPFQCNISGNEQADKLSKRGSHLNQHDQPLSYSEVKAILRYSFHQAWKSRLEMKTDKGDLQCLEQLLQVVIIRLRRVSAASCHTFVDSTRHTPTSALVATASKHYNRSCRIAQRTETSDVKPGQKKSRYKRSCKDRWQHWERLQTSSSGLDWWF